MSSERSELRRELPLPAGWEERDVVTDAIVVGSLQLRRAGVSARNVCGVEATGSAASAREPPLRRAWLELLERTAIVDASEVRLQGTGDRRLARSNGVAAGASWDDACERAALELAERDRVLRAWHGELTPDAVGPPDDVIAIESHDWEACLLGGPTWLPEVCVAVVIGFPRRPDLPLARGFAARRDPNAAVVAAGAEALQGLAFLWHEAPVDAPPEPAPTPIFHLDYYLYPPHHARLRAWLRGEHVGRVHRSSVEGGAVSFVDLTPAHLDGRVRVARAVCVGAESLEFGVGADTLPEELRVHPIP